MEDNFPVKISLGLIFLCKPPKSTTICHQVFHGEFEENITDHRIQNTFRSMNHPLVQTRYKYCTSSLVGSCNGLICLGEPTETNLQDPVHICNPSTAECLHLPGFNKNNEYPNVKRIYSGFGYIPETNEYKVVRILYDNWSGRGDIQVYTLGSGSGWRNIGEITCPVYEEHGVFANGSIYWLDRKGVDIMAFNLSDEKIQVLRTRPFSEHSSYPYILGSFQERLCASTRCGTSTCFDVWTLKNTSSEKNVADDGNKKESWSWYREFSISLAGLSPWRCTPFAVTESGLVLLKYKDPYYCHLYTLYCYDPKTATWTSLGTIHFYEAIPHTNSSVSLKALGETKSKKRKR